MRVSTSRPPKSWVRPKPKQLSKRIASKPPANLKIAIILNGISLQKKYFYQEILPALQGAFEDIEILETLTQNDGPLLGTKAVDRWFDIVLAAGGDGPVPQVENGMLSRRHLYRLPP